MNFLWSLLIFAAFCAECTWARVAANPLVDQQLTLKGRIIGGRNARDGEIPWQVSLQIRGFGHFCGGTIVGRKHIVTAAHCSTIHMINVFVVAGSIYKDTGISFGVRSFKIHPDYVHSTQGNDIAVWEVFNSTFKNRMVCPESSSELLSDTLFHDQVDSPFKWSENIQPVQIANSRVEDGWLMTVSGWGKTDHEVCPDNLQKVEVRIVNMDKCTALYRAKHDMPIYENQICAGGRGKDACFGDSGGPLVKDGVLHGVVSWGPSDCMSIPGVYTVVASFANWIDSVITKDSK